MPRPAIGIFEGWDADLYEDEGFHGDVAAAFRAPAGSAEVRGAPSKAAELLRRASLAAQMEQERDAAQDMLFAALPAEGAGDSSMDPAGEVAFAPVQPHAMLADEPMPWAAGSHGALGSTKLPGGSDADVRELTAQAPKTLRRALSFRASMRGGLVAMPVVRSGPGGAFRVQLLRLDPCGLYGSTAEEPEEVEIAAAVRSGVELLEAQVQAQGVAASSWSGDAAVPRLLVPGCFDAKVLLEKYLDLGAGALGEHAHDAFTLVAALSITGEHGAQRSMLTWPNEEHSEVRQAVRQFSMWLSRTNYRKVRAHLEDCSSRRGFSRVLELGPGAGLAAADASLDAVYHHLAANSVQGALQELRRAGGGSSAASRGHFDRLAAVLSSCGGSSAPCLARRCWLRKQLEEWREQGVNKLMGPALWRIYSLLAGDIDDVVAESLDWRAGFGMFFWYGSPVSAGGERELRKHAEFRKSVCDFEKCAARHGRSCSFWPAPPRSGSSGAHDLCFGIIRAAVGLADWTDCALYDYTTCSARPLDVACSWHCALLLFTFCGGETGCESFQLLTQQYCLLLEMAGLWEWAVYVALFVWDVRARSIIIRRLLQRRAQAASLEDLQPVLQPQWAGVPVAWLWQAQALRSQAAEDWPSAVACWLQSGGDGGKRAAIAAVGFLQGPVLLGHAVASAERDLVAAVSLAPMTPPALWLLSVLEELETTFRSWPSEVWSETGHDALRLMRRWKEHDVAMPHFRPSNIVEFYSKCNMLQRHLLGAPWQR